MEKVGVKLTKKPLQRVPVGHVLFVSPKEAHTIVVLGLGEYENGAAPRQRKPRRRQK